MTREQQLELAIAVCASIGAVVLGSWPAVAIAVVWLSYRTTMALVLHKANQVRAREQDEDLKKFRVSVEERFVRLFNKTGVGR
jgi:predicted phage-related endonuclease